MVRAFRSQGLPVRQPISIRSHCSASLHIPRHTVSTHSHATCIKPPTPSIWPDQILILPFPFATTSQHAPSSYHHQILQPFQCIFLRSRQTTSRLSRRRHQHSPTCLKARSRQYRPLPTIPEISHPPKCVSQNLTSRCYPVVIGGTTSRAHALLPPTFPTAVAVSESQDGRSNVTSVPTALAGISPTLNTDWWAMTVLPAPVDCLAPLP